MIYKKNLLVIVILFISVSFSCKKFIEIEAPKDSLIPSTVFKSNDLATSAVLGMYQQMAANDFASGGERSVSTICGLTADEFIGYNIVSTQPFYQNLIIPENPLLASIWDAPYKRIYDANAILEGLASESGVTPPVKAQLEGEALFVRAFSYFYLVNLFGDIPLQLSTDYKSNSIAKRTSENEIYNQIIKDLKASELLLGNDYVTTDRVRPNKGAVQALLARTYLYIGDWANAEKYSSILIENTSVYNLVSLDQVFLKNSLETIWQLMPPANSNTPAGSLYILTTAPALVSLRPDFVKDAFEAQDLRKTQWVNSISSGGITYYYPYKYKVYSSTTITEYEMVFRLAEQYLIRAEARAQLNNVLGSINDVDKIRSRSGLPLIKDINPLINKIDLLAAIQKERRVELFSEWGDRWLELKRTKKSTEVLFVIKPGWKSTYVLFPIPLSEINSNPNISQNNGY